MEEGAVKLGAFEVFGSKLINLDVPRTRDDVQPYVVFDRSQIENSQATHLVDFFRTRLPMNNSIGSTTYTVATGATYSQSLDLRGLGTNQTLILMDGRRMPNVVTSGAAITGVDINGIPMAMIERIEILPSTASGIYGGGATGGVINIITRKDFSGAILTLNYVNTTDSDSAQRKAELTASTSLRGGSTLLTVTATVSDANDLLTGDRTFAQRARQLAFANNPSLFTNLTTPPRGYTTNIRNQTGANLVLKPQYGGTALSSPYTSVPVGYAGIASDNAAGLVANAGRYNLDLPDDQTGRRSGALTNPGVRSLGISVRQKIRPWLEGYADFLRSRNRGYSTSYSATSTATLAATAPNNPFTTAVSVAFPLTGLTTGSYIDSTTTRVTAGLVAKLPGEWQVGLDYVWGKSANLAHNEAPIPGDPDGPGPGLSYATALSTGALDVIRDLNLRGLDYAAYLLPNPVFENAFSGTSPSATARASGPVYRLPAGDIVVSASAEWRRYETDDGVFTQTPTVGTSRNYLFQPGVSTENRSFYLETRIPLLAPFQGSGRQPRLEVQLAGRHDDSRQSAYAYTGNQLLPSPSGPFPTLPLLTREFRETTWTAGFRYAPVADVTLRASVGTGFLAPSAQQMAAANSLANSSISVADPKRSGILTTVSPVTVSIGGNPNLKPEQSESVSAGMVLTPRLASGFRLSVDYLKIVKTDEISAPSFQTYFDFEEQFPGRIVRAPLTPADQALGYKAGPVTAVDISNVNIARREVEAVDFQADYTRATGLGEFNVYGIATNNLHNIQKALPNSVPVDVVDYYPGSLTTFKWRANGGLEWRRGSWSAGWNTQYYPSIYVYNRYDSAATIASTILTQGASRFSAQFYHDARVSYQFDRSGDGWRRIFSELKVGVGLQNVFNREPPIRAGNVTSVGFMTTEDPRLRRYSVNVQKRL